MLEILARRSTCLKIRTAAMIVKNTQIKGIGYNGTFSNCKECNEYWSDEYKKLNLYISFDEWLKTDEFKNLHREWSLKNEVHAESNALKQISKNDINGCILYTLYSPCDACTKDIIAHNIKILYYKYEYLRGFDALIRLKEHGIECNKIE